MGEYFGSWAGRPVAFTVSLVIPSSTLVAIGRSKVSISVPGVKSGDFLLASLSVPLPGQLTIGDVIAPANNAVDVYVSNTVSLAGASGGTYSLRLLAFRK